LIAFWADVNKDIYY